MGRNQSDNVVPCIPLEKGYVRGYYEKRDGRMVWINPYQNSRDKEAQAGDSSMKNFDTVSAPSSKIVPTSSQRTPTKVENVPQTQSESTSYIVDVIVSMVRTINKFEPGQVVRLREAMKLCRSIVQELGYLDATIKPYFEVPESKPMRLDKGASRETAAMSKEAKRLSRRITKGTVREKVQRLSVAFEDAL